MKPAGCILVMKYYKIKIIVKHFMSLFFFKLLQMKDTNFEIGNIYIVHEVESFCPYGKKWCLRLIVMLWYFVVRNCRCDKWPKYEMTCYHIYNYICIDRHR